MDNKATFNYPSTHKHNSTYNQRNKLTTHIQINTHSHRPKQSFRYRSQHILINENHSVKFSNQHKKKWISNLLSGRKAIVQHNNLKSRTINTKNGVPQGTILSPTLFNLLTSDFPSPQSPHTHT